MGRTPKARMPLPKAAIAPINPIGIDRPGDRKTKKTTLLRVPIAVAAANHCGSFGIRSERPMAIMPVMKAGTIPKR